MREVNGTIHPKRKRNDMAVHAAQDSLERVLAFGGSWVNWPETALWAAPARSRAGYCVAGLWCDYRCPFLGRFRPVHLQLRTWAASPPNGEF